MQTTSTSVSVEVQAHGGCIIRRASRRAGLPEEAVAFLKASITESVTESTLKQYRKSLREWKIFCARTSTSLLEPEIGQVIKFLIETYNADAKYGTLNMYRSALALVLGDRIGKDRWISRLLQGCFRQRPTKPRYDRIYDLEPVLHKIEALFPLESLHLPQLTQRLVIMLASVTARRKQTLSLIKISHIKESTTGFEIEIPDTVKTTRPGACQPILLISRFDENPKLCVARTLRRYLELTSEIRGETQALILTTVKPYRAAARDTISRWLRTFLLEAGIGAEFTPHSIRHAATSAAAKKGVDLAVIKRIAGWSQRSRVFDRFYNRPIIPHTFTFAEALLH